MRQDQAHKYFTFIEWILYFCLCGLSAVFMNEVLDKFFSGKTSFTQSEETLMELPTIVLCFSKTNSRKPQYEYGSDFQIEYMISDKNWNNEIFILKEGINSMQFGETLWLGEIATKYEGNCYNITSEVIDTYIRKQYTNIKLDFNKSITEENLPSYLKIFITSRKNAYGVVISDWKNGKVMKTNVDKGLIKAIDLKPEKHNYLVMNSKCSHESYFECMSRLIAPRLDKSTSKCSKISLPFLQVCKIKKTNEEDYEFWSTWKNVSDLCPNWLCVKLIYFGQEVYYGENIDTNSTNSTFEFGYSFTSNSTTLYEEYLISDMINTIASVGGTLGMCIGFSFTGMISSLINIFQSSFLIFKTKFENHKFDNSMPQNRSLNGTKEIDSNGKQNATLDMEGYLINEIYLEERLEERIVKKLEEKLVKIIKREIELNFRYPNDASKTRESED